jgi:glutaconate CoA-transferase subunit A
VGKLTARLELEELVSTWIPAGVAVALGGLHFHNTPMAVVREIVRQEIAIERLIPPVDGSLNADILIGAGLVREVHTPYVGLEQFGMAGRFRAAAEAGRLRVRETEEVGFMFGLAAGAAGLPFAVLPHGFFPEEEEAPTVPVANPVDYAEITDPFTGKRHHAARAIRPDVAVIHCQLVDGRGNGGFLGGAFHDLQTAKAAEHCLVLAEELVDELPSSCTAHLPGFIVDACCVLEFGAHPGSSHGRYEYDDAHLARYAEASRSDAGFAAYRSEVIGASENEYRVAAGLAGAGAMPVSRREA